MSPIAVLFKSPPLLKAEFVFGGHDLPHALYFSSCLVFKVSMRETSVIISYNLC